jgi:hypothetical protein
LGGGGDLAHGGVRMGAHLADPDRDRARGGHDAVAVPA